MELKKQAIHTYRQQVVRRIQIPLDVDYNIRDYGQDVQGILLRKGQVVIENMEQGDGQVSFSGYVRVRILYQALGETGEIDALETDLPFDHVEEIQDCTRESHVQMKKELEDLRVVIIHSRKLEIKAMVQCSLELSQEQEMVGAVAVEPGDYVECLYKTQTYTNNVADYHDVYRIKEQLTIPQNKPNVQRIIWQQDTINAMETKVVDDGVMLDGELEIFVIYETSEALPMQTLSMELPIHGQITCAGAKEGMVGDIGVEPIELNLTLLPDQDGEMRVLSVEASLELELNIYQEEEIQLLRDIFSTEVHVEPNVLTYPYRELILKNNAKTKVGEHFRIKDGLPGISQVCYVEGSVKVDDMNTTDTGIMVEGAVYVQILYLTQEAEQPLGAWEGYIPFQQEIHGGTIYTDMTHQIRPTLEQISSIMLGMREVEVRASINLNVMVFREGEGAIITGVEIREIQPEEVEETPGIVGYVVEEGDTLWSVAKTYYTSLDCLRQVNQLNTDELQEGQRLIIAKCQEQVV